MNYIIHCMLLMTIVTTGFACQKPKCFIRKKQLPPMNILNRKGKSLSTTAILYHIKVPHNLIEGCYVNTTEYFKEFNLSEDTENIVVFIFRCGQVHPIFLTEYEGKKYSNILTYIQVTRCTIGQYDIQQFTSATTLLVITMHENKYDPRKDPCLSYSRNMSSCAGLERVKAIALTTPPNTTTSNMIEIFNCTNVFPRIAELSLSSQGLTVFPNEFKRKFPNIQKLELEKNKLSIPPEFPWNDEPEIIGYNLSRSVYQDNHYTVPYHLKVPSNVFRRYLNLNFNEIIDLRTFEFSGRLDMISIKHNNLRYINEFTFTKLIGLQSLDLSENLLEEIPSSSFYGLNGLRNLNLRNCSLSNLDKDTFRDQRNLINLDLSSNALTSLPHDIFSRLEKLKSLHLEFNKLTSVPSESFPILSLHLEEIGLQYNPISEFPIVVFYLRQLKRVNLGYTYINFNNVRALLENVDYTFLLESTVESTATNNVDINHRLTKTRKRMIDLTGSNVTGIGYDTPDEKDMDSNITRTGYDRKDKDTYFRVILQNFNIILDKNDILCDCRIIPFSKWIKSQVEMGAFSGDEYFFSDWKCKRPIGLKERPLLSVTEEETYCEVDVEFCPSECKCFRWSVSDIIIVDCRNKSLTVFPEKLPAGTLDLWFQNNNITHIKTMNYFARTRDVILSHNSLSDVSDDIINNFGDAVRKLYLDSNYLIHLPKLIQRLSGVQFHIKDNPFVCDCNTLWMKSWILKHHHMVSDWMDVACAYGNEGGHQLISVEDDKFICLEAFDTIKHVIAPSVSSSVCVLLFIVMLACGFVFRLELKVLIFIYFGLHPFDKDEKDEDEDIDCIIIHSKPLTEWVMEHVVAPLESEDKAYIVCEMSRDFVVGFSYQENICSIVRRSKRMILVLSEDFLVDSDIVKIAWNEAQDKIKDMRTNYAIIVCHEISMKSIDNKDLKRYIKRGRYINTSDKLFFEKILYLMPQYTNIIQRRFPNLRKIVLETYENEDGLDTEEVHAFLSYSDRDINIALKTLTPILQEQRYILHIPDRDFIPGASKEENILNAIDICRHTIFLLSGPYLEDEWSLFTFRTASEKSIRQKCNHMIVIVIDVQEDVYMDEEVKYYIKTHVTLHVTDPWFWEKLAKALPSNQDNKVQLENLNNRINDQIYRQNSVDDRQLEENGRNIYRQNSLDVRPLEENGRNIYQQNSLDDRPLEENGRNIYRQNSLDGRNIFRQNSVNDRPLEENGRRINRQNSLDDRPLDENGRNIYRQNSLHDRPLEENGRNIIMNCLPFQNINEIQENNNENKQEDGALETRC
ncbi:protein toll-like [Mytilus edulis]|uniref:protein toll-like n=1 Tax=Mytilus edulis TaxID=6550 RepID=UPI0039EEB878